MYIYKYIYYSYCIILHVLLQKSSIIISYHTYSYTFIPYKLLIMTIDDIAITNYAKYIIHTNNSMLY